MFPVFFNLERSGTFFPPNSNMQLPLPPPPSPHFTTHPSCSHSPTLHFHLRSLALRSLLAIASASRAHEAQALPLPELQRRAAAALAAIYGQSAVLPTSATCNRWLNDPLFRGTYSSALPGFTDAHVHALQQPHAGSVFLSGEALAWPENGCVSGRWRVRAC